MSKENIEFVHKIQWHSNKWKNGGSQTKKDIANVILKKSGNMKHSATAQLELFKNPCN